MRQSIKNLKKQIKNPYTVAEIIQEWESSDYNAEMLLQHLLVQIEQDKIK